MANTYKLTLDTFLDTTRTTIAAVASLLLARLLKLPEFYWAPISAIVIIQSTIDPRTLAWQRFAGTALGAAMGALIATFFSSSTLVYAVAVFLCGVLCALLRFGGVYPQSGSATRVSLRELASARPEESDGRASRAPAPPPRPTDVKPSGQRPSGRAGGPPARLGLARRHGGARVPGAHHPVLLRVAGKNADGDDVRLRAAELGLSVALRPI